jgi:hypothetical protein
LSTNKKPLSLLPPASKAKMETRLPYMVQT